MPRTRYYPFLCDLYGALVDVRRDARRSARAHADDDMIDVRLQVLTDVHTSRHQPGTGWTLHSGDASYDTDHRGYWGSGSVTAQDTNRALRELARDLIQQAQDDEAQEIDRAVTAAEIAVEVGQADWAEGRRR